jgi:hypothetical protein
MYQVKWIKTPSGTWHLLKTVDLSDVMAAGVFIIWRGGHSPAVIRVGQGDIKTRLEALRADRAIIAHSYDATLFVTWAVVPATHRSGIERYLSNRYKPLVGGDSPDVAPIAVNLAA